jgi:DNA polymerase (family 10)
MHNQQISSIFREIASLLAMQGDDPFRIRAYRRAARTLDHLRESLRSLSQRKALETVPDIGKTLAREIVELLETGRLRYHEHLKTTVPEGLLPLLHLPSLSPEQVRTLWRQHGVTSMKHLVQKYQEGQLPFDTSTLDAIGKDIETWQRRQHRMLLGMALPRAELLIHNLAQLPLVERISLAGSLRRSVDMVSDINIVMASPDPVRLIHLCTQQPEVQQVVMSTSTSTVVMTSEGLRVALVAVSPQEFAPTLLHYTGSAAHIAALQRLAQHRRWSLTAHGLCRLDTQNQMTVVGEEKDIYHLLGLPYIVPELREDSGEIEAALADALPVLMTEADILGDLHVHSDWGNGAHGLPEIAQAAQKMGYQYVGICDYTYSPATSRGLAAAELGKQIAAIRQLNSELPTTCQLLAGAEVEISAEGDIELAEELLQQLDLVIAAIHTGFKAPRKQLTRRLCKAMEHPLVHILAHPTGRMLGTPGMPNIDIEALCETAVDTQTCLEINSHILRLDLQDTYVRYAKDLGVMLSLGSDAHSVQEMRSMRFGVGTARRGWVEARQVLNTLSVQALRQRLKKQDALHVC